MLNAIALVLLPLASVPAQTDAAPRRTQFEPIQTPAGLIHPRRLLVQRAPGASESQLAAAHARAGTTLLRDMPQIGWQVVEVARGSLWEARESYAKERAILRADYDRAKRLAYVPNDPFWPMWHMQKIKADLAWDTHKGSPTVRVAVMDTGLTTTHPDLAANIWTNPGEIAANGIDDDGNGYVDDVHGYDFAYNDPDPNDNFGHGTSCAGIIAARQDNGIGVTGVAPLSQLVGVKAALDTGYFYDSANVPALLYIADMGFQVVSMSFYSDGVTPAERTAIDYCWSHGVLPVAAAGNDSQVLPYYPGAYDNVLSVAATDQNDNKASFSNYGTWVGVGAPGVSLSTVSGSNGYTTGFAGTSGACPHVAGVAALLFSVPGATNASVRAAIEDTAVSLTQAPYGQYMEYGRVDCKAALDRMLGTTSGSKPARLLFAEPVAGGYPAASFTNSLAAPKPRIFLYGVGFETPNVVRVLRNGISLPILSRTRNRLEVLANSTTGGFMEVEVGGVVIASYQHDADLRWVFSPSDIGTQGGGSPVVTGAWKEISRVDGSFLTCTDRSGGEVFVQLAFRKVSVLPTTRLDFEFTRAYDNVTGGTERIEVYDWSVASYPYGTWATISTTPITGSALSTITPSITANPLNYLDPEGTILVQISTTGVPSNALLRADALRVRVQ
ncbi:MAG: S8 family serine peptidase [Planctomycetes bacterium]|nr:S8 family serine peptidase [Planctomycetota bacterium]